MKLTLRPSDPTARHAPPIISITTAHDHLVLADVLDQLVVPALVAFGFHPQAIQDAFGEFEVLGAEPVLGLPAIDDNSVPPGFTYIGQNVEVEGDFSDDDILFSVTDGNTWKETCWMNGGEPDVAYAVRIGSPAHTAYLESL